MLDAVINKRFDPFAETYDPNTISEEEHTIPASSPYWIRLKEIPYEESPSSITVYDVDQDSNMTEVSGVPGDNEFRIDYKYKTGYIQFNSADAGHDIKVSYKGLGSRIIADLWNDRHDLYKAHTHDESNEDQRIGLERLKQTITGESEQSSVGGTHPSSWTDVSGVSYEYEVPEDCLEIRLSLQIAAVNAGETAYVRFRIGASDFSSEESVVGTSYARKMVKITCDPSWRGTTVTLQVQMACNYGASRCKVNGNGDTVYVWCR
jgi:hypothetical protein